MHARSWPWRRCRWRLASVVQSVACCITAIAACSTPAPLYQEVLEQWGMTASMSRRGNCYDNAPMESFFGTLKRELVHQQDYLSRAEARSSIFQYIEVFYNRKRPHSALGYLS